MEEGNEQTSRCARLGFYKTSYWTSLVAQTVEDLPAVRDTQVQSLGGEDPLEKEMATLCFYIGFPHYSSLLLKINNDVSAEFIC